MEEIKEIKREQRARIQFWKETKENTSHKASVCPNLPIPVSTYSATQFYALSSWSASITSQSWSPSIFSPCLQTKRNPWCMYQHLKSWYHQLILDYLLYKEDKFTINCSTLGTQRLVIVFWYLSCENNLLTNALNRSWGSYTYCCFTLYRFIYIEMPINACNNSDPKLKRQAQFWKSLNKNCDLRLHGMREMNAAESVNKLIWC